MNANAEVSFNRKVRIAFIEFGGLSLAGTGRWLQEMAANLPVPFEADYFYCKAAPYIEPHYRQRDSEKARLRYMEEHGVNLIEFTVGAKDITTADHDQSATGFWQVFKSDNYDLVQTATAGYAEYSDYPLKLPIVEYVAPNAGTGKSAYVACSIHPSQWQRARWHRSGGALSRSAVIPLPAQNVATSLGLRASLGIPAHALVAGFHQCVEEHIYSPVPLRAYAMVAQPSWHFLIMGGADAYRRQAGELGLRNVHFVEYSNDPERISRFLNTLDVFAHGRTDEDSFGTALADAMMHGKPSLSHRTRIPNSEPEVMGPAGFVTDGESDYAAKLSKLLSDSDLRAKLARKAKAHAEDYYSLATCVGQLTRIYARVVGLKVPVADNQPAEYGQSDLGFLYSGELCTPSSLGYHVMTGGVPEEFDVYLVRFFLPHIKCFLDVGANTGLYGFFVARHGLDDTVVHAFEPQKACCETMEKTVSLNNWEERVFVHEVAIGSRPAHVQLHLSGTGSTLDNAFNDNKNLPTVLVEVETIDNLAKSLKLSQIDFLKVDVEGYEQAVLEGAKQVIARNHPVIFLELADRIRGRSYRNPNYRKTLTWLQEMGYRVLRSMGNYELRDADLNDEYDHVAMYLCLHRSSHADLESGVRKWASNFVKQKSREKAQRRWGVVRRALRHPLWAASRVVERVKRNGPRAGSAGSRAKHL